MGMDEYENLTNEGGKIPASERHGLRSRPRFVHLTCCIGATLQES